MVPFMAIGVTWVAREATRRWRFGLAVPVAVGVGALVAFVVFLPIWTYQDISVERFDSLMLFDGWVP